MKFLPLILLVYSLQVFPHYQAIENDSENFHRLGFRVGELFCGELKVQIAYQELWEDLGMNTTFKSRPNTSGIVLVGTCNQEDLLPD